MDIVKTRIVSLGGIVTLESNLGKGTKVTLTLYDAPLKLTVVKAMLIKLSEQTYAIPLNLIEEALDIKREDIKRLGSDEAVNVRGQIIPLFQLRKLLGFPEMKSDKHTVLIVRGKSCKFGIIVDSIIDMREIVVRKLEGIIKRVKGIKGATILENGQVILILDPASLLDERRRKKIENLQPNARICMMQIS